MFAQGNQGRNNFDLPLFCALADDLVESVIVGWATIGIPRAILLDRANINLPRSPDLSPAYCHREKMGIPEGDVRDRDRVTQSVGLGNRDACVRQRRSAYRLQSLVANQQAILNPQPIANPQKRFAFPLFGPLTVA